MSREIFKLNPALDRDALAAAFARDGRIQVRNLLTEEAAEEIYRVLAGPTPWGIAWQAGDAAKPQAIEAPELQQSGDAKAREIAQSTYKAAANCEYAFQFGRYPILNAYLGKWNEGSAYDVLLEHINSPDYL